MSYTFNFPKNRRAGGPDAQLAKMREELEEVAVEVDHGDPVDMLVETLDLMEAAEGLLRCYEGTELLSLAYDAHELKNTARGDYEVMLTPKEAAKMLGITTATLYRWLKDGTVPGVKLENGRWMVERQALKENAPERTTRLLTIDDALTVAAPVMAARLKC